MRTIDLTGQKFGLLTVTGKSPTLRKAGALWLCQCECGGATSADSMKLRKGLTKSCGCRQFSGLSRVTHGYSKAKSPTYRTWKEMRQRCQNPNSDKWKWYGGRGVSVCPQWEVFEIFLADMGERPAGHTLDRRDSDGNYEKDNCRWATPKQQAETNRGVFKKGHNSHALRTVEKIKGAA